MANERVIMYGVLNISKSETTWHGRKLDAECEIFRSTNDSTMLVSLSVPQGNRRTQMAYAMNNRHKAKTATQTHRPADFVRTGLMSERTKTRIMKKRGQS